MSVLDSFVFLLKADSRDAVRGIHDTGEEFDDLKDKGQDATKKIDRDVKGMGSTIKDVAANSAASFQAMAVGMLGAVAAGASLTGIIEQLGQQVTRAQNAASTGINIGQYDALEGALGALGLEADDVRDNFMDLNEFLGDPDSGDKWKALGVNIKDANGQLIKADEAMLRLAGSVEKMSAQDATAKLRALGVSDPKVIGVLMQGRGELERMIKLRKELGVQSDDDTKKAKEFQNAVGELNMIFDAMAEAIAQTVAPALTTLVDGIAAVVKWAREHKPLLISIFGVLAAVAIPALTTALWGMATAAWAAIAPFLPFIAAAIALGLVIEDLWVYFNGGNSVLGELAQKFPWLADLLENTRNEVESLIMAFKAFMEDPVLFMETFGKYLEEFWDGIIKDAQSGIDNMIKVVVDKFDELTEAAKAPFIALWNFITNLFSKIGDEVGNKISGAIDSINSYLPESLQISGGSQKKSGTVQGANVQSDIPNDNPFIDGTRAASAATAVIGNAASAQVIPPSGGARTTINNTTVSPNVNQTVNVNGGDPNAVRTAVSDGLSDHLKGTAQSWNDGVSH